jgi:hypothetical protein
MELRSVEDTGERKVAVIVTLPWSRDSYEDAPADLHALHAPDAEVDTIRAPRTGLPVSHPFTSEGSCVDWHLCRSRHTEDKKARYDDQEEARDSPRTLETAARYASVSTAMAFGLHARGPRVERRSSRP